MAEKQQFGPIAICTHVFENVNFDVYFNHLYCAAHWGREYDLVFVGKSGLNAATARNRIIERCFEKGCSHALFLDGDHFVPIETLSFLLETADQAMVSGLVNKRGESYQQICFLIKKVDGRDQFFQVELPLDGQVHGVSVCPFGCTLINLEKLKKLKKPYFRDTCAEVDETGVPANIRSDVNLCRAFLDIGEQIWVDTRVLVGHRGIPATIYPQSAKLFHKLKEIETDITKLSEGQVGRYYIVGVREGE